MLGNQRHHHTGVLTSLRPMNRAGVGQRQLVQLVSLVTDGIDTGFIRKFNPRLPRLRQNRDYRAQIAVEDAARTLVVVVAHRHDLVAGPERVVAIGK